MIAPAVARIVADAVTGAAPDETLDILDFARFEEDRLVPEPQLV
jgi:glycine/D-amino acid oxidase-like deaminating enzyme